MITHHAFSHSLSHKYTEAKPRDFVPMTMQPPAWVEPYVGVPFADLGRTREGCDCWGLVRLILAEQRGLVLPCYATSYRTETNWQGVAREIGTAQAGGDWHRIDESEVRAFDVVSLLMPLRIPGSGPGTHEFACG